MSCGGSVTVKNCLAATLCIFLHDARRPFDAHRLSYRRVTEAHVRSQVILALATAAARNLAELPHDLPPDRRFDPDFGADGGAVRKGPDQFEVDPVIAIAVVVIEKISLAGKISVRHIQIQEPVVVVIAPSRGDGLDGFIDGSGVGDFGKCAIAVVVEEKVSRVPVKPIGHE